MIPVSQMGSLDKIGQGGQGIVYRAPSVRTTFAKSMVYKQYKPAALAALDIDALRSMPTFLENLPYRDGARLISLASWPCAIVEENDQVVGFVMPAIPDEFFIEFWTNKPTPSRVAAELQHLLNEPQVLTRQFRGTTVTDLQRYELIRQTAAALAFLHERQICVGDISPKNLLFSLTSTPAIYFIDCDAMRVKGASLTPQLETPGWEVPHGEELATTHSDRYKLGLLALRLLAGSQQAKTPDRLPKGTPVMLRQVITDTLTQPPDQRPSLATWDLALERAKTDAPNQPPLVPLPTTPPPTLNQSTYSAPPPAHSIPAYSAPTHTYSAPPPAYSTPTYSTPTPTSQHNPQPTPQSTTNKLAWLLIPAALIITLITYQAIAKLTAPRTINSEQSATTTQYSSSTTTTTSDWAYSTSIPTPAWTSEPERSQPSVPNGYEELGMTCPVRTALTLKTTKSLVVICDDGSGYTYKGLRLKDNSRIDIEGATLTSDGFIAFNEGTRYMVTWTGLEIHTPDGEYYNEPAIP